MDSITKVFFQTNKSPNNDHINMIKSKLGENWTYEFYDDSDVIDFFKYNPCQEYPDIITKYNSIKKGAHRADLFRYYYIYLKESIISFS